MFAAIRLVSDRLSAVTARGMDAVSLPAPVRLAKALLHLAELGAESAEGGLHIGFRLSQRELGAMTGLTRESINKHLRAWRAAGWVELAGARVLLSDVVALRNYVQDSEPQ
jgi:CRP-like cAMP-binding protein